MKEFIFLNIKKEFNCMKTSFHLINYISQNMAAHFNCGKEEQRKEKLRYQKSLIFEKQENSFRPNP